MSILGRLLKKKPGEAEEDYMVDEPASEESAGREDLDSTEEELVLDREEEDDAETEDAEDAGQLALDVFQDRDNIVIRSTIAGVSPDDLDITVASDTVIIKGERRQQHEVAEDDYFYKECYWGNFSRSLPLPVEIDVDKAKADIKDGVLILTLPKASATRTKKIKVKGGE